MFKGNGSSFWFRSAGLPIFRRFASDLYGQDSVLVVKCLNCGQNEQGAWCLLEMCPLFGLFFFFFNGNTFWFHVERRHVIHMGKWSSDQSAIFFLEIHQDFVENHPNIQTSVGKHLILWWKVGSRTRPVRSVRANTTLARRNHGAQVVAS